MKTRRIFIICISGTLGKFFIVSLHVSIKHLKLEDMKAKTILITTMILLAGSLLHVSAQNSIEKNSLVLETQQARFGDLVNNQVNLQYLNTFDNNKPKLLVLVHGKSGELIYSKRISRKRNLDIEFDISDFPTGIYSFELYNKRELVCSKIIAKQHIASSHSDDVKRAIIEDSAFLKTRQARFSSRSNSKVNLQFIDTYDEKLRYMKVRVFKESDDLIYADNFYRKGNLNIDFDISKFPRGNYTFQFYNKDQLVCSKVITKQAQKQNENLVAILYSKDK